MKHVTVIALLMLSACVGTPVRDSIPQLLVGREVVYTPGAADPNRQTWAADGTTVFFRGGTGLFSGPLKGRWVVEDGKYCAWFGNNTSDARECWWVSTSEGGRNIRFKKADFELIDFGPNEYNGVFVK